MKQEKTGWVVINNGHPSKGAKFIVAETFSLYKKDAIKSFIKGQSKDWDYWRKIYRYECVRCTMTISTI